MVDVRWLRLSLLAALALTGCDVGIGSRAPLGVVVRNEPRDAGAPFTPFTPPDAAATPPEPGPADAAPEKAVVQPAPDASVYVDAHAPPDLGAVGAPGACLDGRAADPVGDAAGPGAWTLWGPAARPASSWPPPRHNPAIAYDLARDRVVMFGGSHELRDLWEWDPQAGSWTDRTPAVLPASWPAPRYTHMMVYDAARGRTLMFGGGTTVGVSNETWEWDGVSGTWEQRQTAGAPPPLTAAGMAFDSARGKVVLFGGHDNSAPGETDRLWEWTGAAGTWVEGTPAARPPAWPAARTGPTLVYDSFRRKAVLFGGIRLGETLRDVWEWDGAAGTWTDRTPPMVPSPWPGPRYAHGAAFDARTGMMLVFGGAPCVGSNLWEWIGMTGTWRDRTLPPPALWPEPRAPAAMTFDSKRGATFMYGADELWSWWPGL